MSRRCFRLRTLRVLGLCMWGPLLMFSRWSLWRGRKKRVKTTVKTMLEQCRKLDSLGLDHGELSRAHKNVLVTGDDRPWILDFESASISRRPSNFTSLTQYLFLGGGMARKVCRVLGPVEREELLKCLRRYKAGDVSAFQSAMGLLGL